MRNYFDRVDELFGENGFTFLCAQCPSAIWFSNDRQGIKFDKIIKFFYSLAFAILFILNLLLYFRWLHLVNTS